MVREDSYIYRSKVNSYEKSMSDWRLKCLSGKYNEDYCYCKYQEYEMKLINLTQIYKKRMVTT